MIKKIETVYKITRKSFKMIMIMLAYLNIYSPCVSLTLIYYRPYGRKQVQL